MREPMRLREDPAALLELQQMLGHAARSRPLDRATRQRMGRRLDRFLALPLVLTLGLTMKTAAASLAITAGAVSIGAVAVHELRVLQSMSTPLIGSPSVSRSRAERSAASAMVAEALLDEPLRASSGIASAAFRDEETPSSDVHRAELGPVSQHVKPAPQAEAREPSAASKSSGDGLAREAAMLEAARRALGSSPAEALAIAEEHRAEFPSARLELERELIRVDALYRLGRHAEARQAAEVLRRRGGLYAERVKRIIEKMDSNQE